MSTLEIENNFSFIGGGGVGGGRGKGGGGRVDKL